MAVEPPSMALRPRLVVVAAALALALCAPWWAAQAATSSAPAPDAEQGFVADIAAARDASGLRSYAVADDLSEVARRWAAQMAADGRLAHNPDLADDVQDWQAVGENVGTGGSEPQIHQAFMDSPHHRDAILSEHFTQVGVGVVVDGNGVMWVSEVFRLPMAAAKTASAPAPATGSSTAGGVQAKSATTAPRAPAPAPRPAPVASASSGPGARAVAAPAAMAAPAAADAAISQIDDVRRGLTADGAVHPSGAPFAAPAAVGFLPAAHVAPATGREVSGPAAIAAAMLVLVVSSLTAAVRPNSAPGRPGRSYRLVPAASAAARRHRSHASISGSRSPSSTAWTFPVS